MNERPLTRVALLLVVLSSALSSGRTRASDEYDLPPIQYSASRPTDAIANLQAEIDRGTLHLQKDEPHGYLAAVLAHLNIPASSQTLVFSKTSLQREFISPSTPRAIYFNDDVYVGFVKGSDTLEFASADPELGIVFYTLDQRRAKPKFVRQTDSCLQCHASAMTRDIPGLMIRSVYPDSRGQPLLAAGTFLTTSESPVSQRWGGWYVTGAPPGLRHMGNRIVKDEEHAETAFAADAPATATAAAHFDVSAYLSDGSDAVALLVLAHQVEIHDLIARANYGVRMAERDAAAINTALGRPNDYVSDSTRSRIKSCCEPLVRCLLFADESPLPVSLGDTSAFATEYARRAPATRAAAASTTLT